MCICLNCNRIISCKIYNLISKKHKENQTKFSFSFSPQSPIIQILLSSFNNGLFIEWDVNECLSFEENPGIWIISDLFYSFNSNCYLRYDTAFTKIKI